MLFFFTINLQLTLIEKMGYLNLTKKTNYRETPFLLTLSLLFIIFGALIQLLAIRHFGHSTINFGISVFQHYTPLLCAAWFLLLCSFNHTLSSKVVLFTFLVFFALILLLAPHWFDVMTIAKDDSLREFITAKNMIANNTLFGGDNLYFNNDTYAGYKFQPGFRYFLALELLLFKQEFRVLEYFNQLLFLLTLIFFLKTIHNKIIEKHFRLLVVFIFLSIPAVTNMINHFLTEWLIIVLFMLFFSLKINNRNIFALVILSLIPFFRQNLLLFVLVLFFLFYIRNHTKTAVLTSFTILVAVLLLPIYHNFFYTNSITFFVKYPSVHHLYFFDVNNPTVSSIIISFFQKLFLYTGIKVNYFNLAVFFEALLVLPFGCYLVYYFIKENKFKLWQLLVLFTTVVLPYILVGFAYYPRFEVQNFYIIFMFFVFVIIQKKKKFTTT